MHIARRKYRTRVFGVSLLSVWSGESANTTGAGTCSAMAVRHLMGVLRVVLRGVLRGIFVGVLQGVVGAEAMILAVVGGRTDEKDALGERQMRKTCWRKYGWLEQRDEEGWAENVAMSKDGEHG